MRLVRRRSLSLGLPDNGQLFFADVDDAHDSVVKTHSEKIRSAFTPVEVAHGTTELVAAVGFARIFRTPEEHQTVG